jgi:hypothetical protein
MQGVPVIERSDGSGGFELSFETKADKGGKSVLWTSKEPFEKLCILSTADVHEAWTMIRLDGHATTHIMTRTTGLSSGGSSPDESGRKHGKSSDYACWILADLTLMYVVYEASRSSGISEEYQQCVAEGKTGTLPDVVISTSEKMDGLTFKDAGMWLSGLESDPRTLAKHTQALEAAWNQVKHLPLDVFFPGCKVGPQVAQAAGLYMTRGLFAWSVENNYSDLHKHLPYIVWGLLNGTKALPPVKPEPRSPAAR